MNRSFAMGRVAALIASLATSVPAVTFTPFTPTGGGGTINGQQLTVGAGGTVYELDSFIHVQGFDLNGAETGTCGRLTADAMPTGLVYRFDAWLTNSAGRLVLSYCISNSSASTFRDVRFFSFLDPEIDQNINTFYDEYATMAGAPGQGDTDAAPEYWLIDEPGYSSGTIVQELQVGVLGNANRVPQGRPNDVSMALGFRLGDLSNGLARCVRIMIAEDGGSTGAVVLTQRDTSTNSTTAITYSGESDFRVSDEPGWVFTNVTPHVTLTWAWQLDRQTGALRGSATVRLTDPQVPRVGAPFQFGLHGAGPIHFLQSDGTLPDGDPYVDRTSPMLNALRQTGNRDDYLDPGEDVTVGPFDVFTPNRAAPSPGLFRLWSMRYF